MNFGLLGRKLGHSYSPQIHTQLGSYTYKLYEYEPENIETFLKNGQFTGLNVTTPYKKAVIRLCTELSPTAKKLGAVNTIVRQSDGGLIGHNTDYYGFQSTLAESGLSVSGKKALILGSGGASATVVAVLQELGADVTIISRTGDNNYSNLEKHADAVLIVNATPVGMYPDTDVAPVSLDWFPKLEGVIDLIYNPARTRLLQQAEERGLITQNGLWMLIAQAKESAEWFTGTKIPNDRIRQIYKQLNVMTSNIILIGMPGSGKTTIGKILAKITGRKFLDTDTYLEETVNMKIPDIFAKYGENYFRNLETEALAKLCKLSGSVIATGGGCVTRTENYPLLHQNGTIVWVQRDLTSLSTKGRPLSQSGNLSDMYLSRMPFYNEFSDMTVQNNSDPETVAAEILSRLQMEV